jgi:glycosyltransferase involved in cell wall biosynthesis
VTLTVIAVLSWLLAASASFTFLSNLRIYRPASRLVSQESALSTITVLIPARNEEGNILEAIDSILADSSSGVRVIVGDDHSSDRTAELVAVRAAQDGRVSLLSIPSLPAGWNGKQHACERLAEAAQSETLLFMDADVRLEEGALGRMVEEFGRSGASLLSGVPRQICDTWVEQLLIPLIHFVLLAYLPMRRMRRSLSPAYAAGCGQMFLCSSSHYKMAGGHAAIQASMHDGITLPRAFRLAGLKSDLFDATDIARCRMYAGGRQVLAGLTKNAVEGLAKPSRILVFTVLFFFGHILPFPLAIYALWHSEWLAGGLLLAASVLAYLPRFAAVRRFQQPVWSAIAHPLGVFLLIWIQWRALLLHLAGKRSEWKGRGYGNADNFPKTRVFGDSV